MPGDYFNKMKTRILITVFLVAIYNVALKLYLAAIPPVAAAAGAKQLDDTTGGYFAAKAVRDGLVESIMFWCFIISVTLVWVIGFRNKNKNSV